MTITVTLYTHIYLWQFKKKISWILKSSQTSKVGIWNALEYEEQKKPQTFDSI